MNTCCFEEGQALAQEALQALHVCQSSEQRRALLADAIGELIDVSLGWNNLACTQDRLLGFSQVLADILQAPEACRQASSSKQCCATWRKAFARLKALGSAA